MLSSRALDDLLYVAAYNGCLVDVKKYYDAGGRIDALYEETDDKHQPMQPIHVATVSGHLEVVQWLHSKDAALHARAFDGLQPIHFACTQGRLEVMEWLSSQE